MKYRLPGRPLATGRKCLGVLNYLLEIFSATDSPARVSGLAAAAVRRQGRRSSRPAASARRDGSGACRGSAADRVVWCGSYTARRRTGARRGRCAGWSPRLESNNLSRAVEREELLQRIATGPPGSIISSASMRSTTSMGIGVASYSVFWRTSGVADTTRCAMSHAVTRSASFGASSSETSRSTIRSRYRSSSALRGRYIVAASPDRPVGLRWRLRF